MSHKPGRRHFLRRAARAATAFSFPSIRSQAFGGKLLACAGMPITAQQSTLLWYDEPALHWVEALPVGNGRLGAMVFGGTRDERLQLNEDTLYAGGPYDPNNAGALGALPEARRLIFGGKYQRPIT